MPGVAAGSWGAGQALCLFVQRQSSSASLPSWARAFQLCLNSKCYTYRWVTCSVDGPILSCPAWIIQEYPGMCSQTVSHQQTQELGSPRKPPLYFVYFFHSLPHPNVTRGNNTGCSKMAPTNMLSVWVRLFYFFSVLKYPKLQLGFKQYLPRGGHHKAPAGVPTWFHIHWWLSESTISFVILSGQECWCYIWSENGRGNAKAVVQNLFALPVALERCRIARFDVPKQHFFICWPFLAQADDS